MTDINNNRKRMHFTPDKDLVAYAPINLIPGTVCTNFYTVYMFDAEQGKNHLNLHPDSFRVHLRVFSNVEVAICDDPRHVFIAGTQFWSEVDTYSIFTPELNVTITAPRGFSINIDELTPAIKKLQNARELIDSAKEGEVSGKLSDDDGLRVLITVVSKNYPINCTLFESPDDATTVTFAACNRSELGKISGDGLEKDDFLASFHRLMDLHHMWIYLRVLLGYEYPYITDFDIDSNNIEWSGILLDNDA